MLLFRRAALRAGAPRGALPARSAPVRSLVTASSRSAPRWAPWAAALGTLGAVAVSLALAPPLALDAPRERTVHDAKTSLELPALLEPDGTSVAAGGPMRLVGLGVRTVTFLNIHVYVAALYVSDAGMAHARAPVRADGTLDLEAQMRAWLDAGVACAIRVVPVRATDLSHLRDGLVRAANVRAKDVRALLGDEPRTHDADRAFQRDLLDFKALFPRSKIARGQPLDLVVQKTARATYMLSLQLNGKELGTVESTGASTATLSLPTALMLAYMGERPDVSAVFRDSVRHGLTQALP